MKPTKEILTAAQQYWNDYKAFLKNKYPPEEGKEFEFTCEHHKKIDQLFSQPASEQGKEIRFELTSYQQRYRTDYGVYMWIGKDLYSISATSTKDAEEKKRKLELAFSLLPDVTEEIINTKIDEITDLHRYKVSGYPDSYGSYSEGWSDACDILGEAILNLFRKEGR